MRFYCVMDVKFWKLKLHFGVLEVTRHVATVCWQWSGLLLGSSLHFRECLNKQFVYLNSITQCCKVTGLTHDFHACNIKDCYICGDGSGLDIKKLLCCVRDLFGFILYKVSRIECIWKIVLSLVNSTSSWAPLVKVHWLFLFVVPVLNFQRCTGLYWKWGKAVLLFDRFKVWLHL